MTTRVEELKTWFKRLNRKEQEEILEFLYDKVLINEGLYCGPALTVATEGLFCGPAPISNQQVNLCPTCKQPI